MEGLEPSHLAALPPQGSVSTNSTTIAKNQTTLTKLFSNNNTLK
ncbi:hypothetical protein ENHAE0001_1618 [Enhydrobacter aerosaccus SK60]|nr:hypothetical protein ENHAE0001_1618 [Enhydrobacter aerosaccus SK60]